MRHVIRFTNAEGQYLYVADPECSPDPRVLELAKAQIFSNGEKAREHARRIRDFPSASTVMKTAQHIPVFILP